MTLNVDFLREYWHNLCAEDPSLLCEDASNNDGEYREVISYSKLPKLQTLFDKWRKRGAEISFEIVEPIYNNNPNKCVVKVSGGYKNDDWEFAATIDHNIIDDKRTNIIRAMPGYVGKIPERYKTSSPYCEYCRTERVRNDTYIVHNTKTDEYKQVGRNCLKVYTGFDAASVVANASAFKEINDLLNLDEEENELSRSEDTSGNPTIIKLASIAVVKVKGYDKEKFVSSLIDASGIGLLSSFEQEKIQSSLYQKYSDELKQINAWVETLKDIEDNDYLRNAYITWHKPWVNSRDYKLIGSLVASYYREQAKLKASSDFKPVGNKGDKITFTVSTKQVLYSKGSYSYRGPETLVYKIVDTNGNVYVWSTASEFEEGDTITATIDNPNYEYKGEKQTIITRGKIVAHKVKEEPTVDVDTTPKKDMFADMPNFGGDLGKEAAWKINKLGDAVLDPSLYTGNNNPYDDILKLIDDSMDLELFGDDYLSNDELIQYKKNVLSWAEQNPEQVERLRQMSHK